MGLMWSKMFMTCIFSVLVRPDRRPVVYVQFRGKRGVVCGERFTIKYSDLSLKGFCWNKVGPASQTVAQHYISIGPMHRVIWCFWRRDEKRHLHSHSYAALKKHGAITQSCFNVGPAPETVGQH